ncbi:uncharacterized protein [Dermacentor andersoni]
MTSPGSPEAIAANSKHLINDVITTGGSVSVLPMVLLSTQATRPRDHCKAVFRGHVLFKATDEAGLLSATNACIAKGLTWNLKESETMG